MCDLTSGEDGSHFWYTCLFISFCGKYRGLKIVILNQIFTLMLLLKSIMQYVIEHNFLSTHKLNYLYAIT